MPLRSKCTGIKLSTEGVHKRGGEFIEGELQKAVNTKDQNERVINEIIELAAERKAWLIFCTGVKHANAMCDILKEHDVPSACITGATPKAEREAILKAFKTGSIKAVTNANVLTTGFDYPDIDLIAMCRPTMSPGLYIQMAGRGMRPKSHTDHCLVLDFAGVVSTHGPITAVQPPKKVNHGSGECPVKVCESCNELVHLSVRVCPACGAEFPPPKPKSLKLHDDDIMGIDKHISIRGWMWRKETSCSGKEMLTVTYYSDNILTSITEYFCLLHGGYTAQRALQMLFGIARKCDAAQKLKNPYDLEETAAIMNLSAPPLSITTKKDGNYRRVIGRSWHEPAA